MTLLIMAAGMGSRYGGLKQIDPMGPNGEFILDYSIYDAIRAGIQHVVFIIKEENYEIFRDTVGKRIENQVQVDYVFQDLKTLKQEYDMKDRVKPLGTAHAILCAKDVIKDNFIVINSDDFYGREPFSLITKQMELADTESTDFTMVSYPLKNTLTKNGSVKRGICKEKEGFLEQLIESEIKEEKVILTATSLIDSSNFEVDPDTEVSMNFFGFTPKIFEYLELGLKEFLEKNKENLATCEYLIPEVLEQNIKHGTFKIKILKTTSLWHGVTYQEDKQEVKEAIQTMIEQKKYPDHLWK